MAFASADWNVVTCDNLSRDWRDFVRWGPLIEGEVLDQDRLTAAFAGTTAKAIAHLAALA